VAYSLNYSTFGVHPEKQLDIALLESPRHCYSNSWTSVSDNTRAFEFS